MTKPLIICGCEETDLGKIQTLISFFSCTSTNPDHAGQWNPVNTEHRGQHLGAQRRVEHEWGEAGRQSCMPLWSPLFFNLWNTVRLIYKDFRKVFETMSQELLLDNMEKNGLEAKITMWINNWLNNYIQSLLKTRLRWACRCLCIPVPSLSSNQFSILTTGLEIWRDTMKARFTDCWVGQWLTRVKQLESEEGLDRLLQWDKKILASGTIK